MNTEVDPCTNFYAYASTITCMLGGGYERREEIPKGRHVYDIFVELAEQNDVAENTHCHH
ncbi:hypothetical protein BGZ72_000531 [Mortierella alpina]|nr:hypothetical protein BGZ72_000531 [Mortierella alpina]